MTVNSPAQPTALLERVASLASLSADAVTALSTVVNSAYTLPANRSISHEGRTPLELHLVLDGWCCRYNTLSNGRRQIPAILLPGDFCDLGALMGGRVHFGVATLTTATIGLVSREELRRVMAAMPEINRAIWLAFALDHAITVEWAVSLGRRSSEERLAHLLCELFVRLEATGLTRGATYMLPLTQEVLADALGVSAVHINRTLQSLRRRRLVSLDKRRLAITSWDALTKAAGFETDYLQPTVTGKTPPLPHAPTISSPLRRRS